ncbi:hypothetical protein GIB67_038904, partial [Kingdonia uniflora]
FVGRRKLTVSDEIIDSEVVAPLHLIRFDYDHMEMDFHNGIEELLPIAVKDIITKNPQSKYLDIDHDHLAQVFGPVKMGCVNFMGPDVIKKFIQSTQLLRAQIMDDKESYIDLENGFSQYKVKNDARFESLKDMMLLLDHLDGASHLLIPYFLKAFNGLMALPILGSITTFEAIV